MRVNVILFSTKTTANGSFEMNHPCSTTKLAFYILHSQCPVTAKTLTGKSRNLSIWGKLDAFFFQNGKEMPIFQQQGG